MEKLELPAHEDDWKVLTSFLPAHWELEAKRLGALRRCRKFADADALLRTLLIHLAEGCSLRETAVRARKGGIASVSDVALLKRLKRSGEWFRWMAMGLMQAWIEKQPSSVFGDHVRLRIVDGSNVQEPGSTGSSWRIHYSIRLPSLQCDEVYVTEPKVGESFTNFGVRAGDVFLGDRGYAHRRGIAHVVGGGGDVLVRINLTNVPLENPDGSCFALLQQLRTLQRTQLGDWPVWVRFEDERMEGRLCALKKDQRSAERARKKVLKENGRKGQVKPETLEAAGYIFVFTTLDRDAFAPTAILEIYRGRWQVELVFKRLKSIISLGHLKKIDPESAQAWIHGKLVVAFLIEALLVAGERFFPWGYPICPDLSPISVPMEGNVVHAPSR